jgi:hypothetical protein
MFKYFKPGTKQEFHATHPEYMQPEARSPPDLTRHWFRAEDVRASLFAAICDQKREHVLYWTQELIDSSAAADIIFTLIFTYLINFSHTRLDYLCNLAQVAANPTPEGLRQAAYNLYLAPSDARDSSFFLTALHIPRKAPTQEIKIQITPQTLQVIQRPSEFWLGGAKSPILDDYLQHLLWLTTTYTNVHPGTTAIVNTWRPIPLSLQDSLDTWAAKLGRRARRLPFMNARNLYGMTARGATWETQTATDELNCAHETFHLSPYWSAICPKLPRDDDTQVWEEFITQVFFTDDIPDEWSTPDKAMSHGGGALYTSSKCPKVGKWMHTWVPQPALAMSGWRSTVFERIEHVELIHPVTIYDWLAAQIQDTLLQRAMKEMDMEGDDNENLMED